MDKSNSTKKILLLDPKSMYEKEFSQFFGGKGHLVITLTNLVEVIDCIRGHQFQFFILDLDLGKNDFLIDIFLEAIIENPSSSIYVNINNSPIENFLALEKDLLMAGVNGVFQNKMTPEEIYELKENKTPKMFRIFRDDSSKRPHKDIDFHAIEIDKFYLDHFVMFDIYLKVGHDLYVKLFNASERFDAEKLKDFVKDDCYEFVYISKNDRLKFIEFCQNIQERFFQNEEIDGKDKKIFIRDTLESFLEEVYFEGLSKEAIEIGKKSCDKVLKLIENTSDLLSLLNELEEMLPTAQNHALLVTYLSAMIGSRLKENSGGRDILGLASMFHDIGKRRLSKFLLRNPYEKMNQEEKKEYEKHPALGAEMTSSHKMMNPLVSLIIAQHHEALDGTGFPNKLSGEDINIWSQVLFLANKLSHVMIDRNVSSIEAMKELLKDEEFNKKLHVEVLNCFFQICKDKFSQDMNVA